jgi:uncharacterized membrane protein YphA (DoxX/SURF4 family)
MNDSMAQPREGLLPLGLPGWKSAVSWLAAAAIAILFLSSGLWKITDPQGWAVRLAQAKVPQSLSLPGALLVGIAETVGAVLILLPRFRRWGAFLTGALLLLFLVYFAINYTTLRGQDCSCFPWLKRVVGPGFFLGDGAMLLLAAAAGVWSQRPTGLRTASLIVGAVAVFALVSYGVNEARQTGTRAPETITVDGQPYSLSRGKIFLFFFNPECTHCLDAAKRMSQYAWGETKVVGIPVEQKQFGPAFLAETGLKAGLSPDFDQLKTIFAYTAYPFGVVLENGREKAAITQFEGEEPQATLKKFGLVN